MDSEWLGYHVSSPEIKTALALCGVSEMYGLNLGGPLTGEQAGKAFRSLADKGLAWAVDQEIGLDRTFALVLKEVGAALCCLRLTGSYGNMTVYRCPRMWVIIQSSPEGQWRMEPVQTEEEAWAEAWTFVSGMEGHLQAGVRTAELRTPLLRLGLGWQQRLRALWRSMHTEKEIAGGADMPDMTELDRTNGDEAGDSPEEPDPAGV